MVCGLILVPYPLDAPRSVWMSHSFAGCRRAWHASYSRHARRAERFPNVGLRSAGAAWFAVPLRQQGEFIGTLSARRIEVRPFTPAQIKLLETFADQAVIAIENVRLFKELQERTRELVRIGGGDESSGRSRPGGELQP